MPIDTKNRIKEYGVDYLSTAPIELPKLPFPLTLSSPSNWVILKKKTVNKASKQIKTRIKK